jgi:hypothetical protein
LIQLGTVELRLYGKGVKERTLRIPAEGYRRIMEMFHFHEGEYMLESRMGQHFKRECICREIACASRTERNFFQTVKLYRIKQVPSALCLPTCRKRSRKTPAESGFDKSSDIMIAYY